MRVWWLGDRRPEHRQNEGCGGTWNWIFSGSFWFVFVFWLCFSGCSFPIRVKPRPTVLKVLCSNHWTARKFLLRILNAMIRNVCYILLWFLALYSFFLQEKYTSPFHCPGILSVSNGRVYKSVPLTLGLVMWLARTLTYRPTYVIFEQKP